MIVGANGHSPQQPITEELVIRQLVSAIGVALTTRDIAERTAALETVRVALRGYVGSVGMQHELARHHELPKCDALWPVDFSDPSKGVHRCALPVGHLFTDGKVNHRCLDGIEHTQAETEIQTADQVPPEIVKLAFTEAHARFVDQHAANPKGWFCLCTACDRARTVSYTPTPLRTEKPEDLEPCPRCGVVGSPKVDCGECGYKV